MSVKSKDFIAKARGIVGGVRPRSLGDFLDDDKQDDVRKAVETEGRTDDVRKAVETEGHTDDVRKAVETESRIDDVRKAVETESRIDDVRKAVETESRIDDVRKAEDRKTGREEFRFNTNLIERLRRCAFETRRKKTAIVQEALDRYLKAQGY